MAESRKDRKRLSRIIKVEFGKEVGISLEELEDEFDEMISAFESQKANLHDYTPSVIPIREHPTLQLDPTLLLDSNLQLDPMLSASTTSLNKKAARLKEMLNCTGKHSRSSFQDATPSRQSLNDEASPAKTCRSETSSIDLDADVFLSSTDDLNGDGPIEFTAPHDKRGKSPAHSWLNKKLQSSPRSNGGDCGKGASDNRVLVPPVLVDGELTSNYQYFTPSIPRKCDKEQKASTLSKLMGKPPEFSKGKKGKESTLKAMYEATVRNPCTMQATTTQNISPFTR